MIKTNIQLMESSEQRQAGRRYRMSDINHHDHDDLPVDKILSPDGIS